MAEDLKAKLASDKKAKIAADKKAKSRRAKAVIALIPKQDTFASLVPPAYASRYWGFVYRIWITMSGKSLVYTGSKRLGADTGWSTYTSSSERVCKLIEASRSYPALIQVRYEVLSYHTAKAPMLSAESTGIWAMVRQYGVDSVLNIRDAHGVSLRTGKMIGSRSPSKSTRAKKPKK